MFSTMYLACTLCGALVDDGMPTRFGCVCTTCMEKHDKEQLDKLLLEKAIDRKRSEIVQLLKLKGEI